MNPRIRINRIKSAWGVNRYDVFVDNSTFAGTYRTKKEAITAGEKRIEKLAEEERQLGEYINELYEDGQ